SPRAIDDPMNPAPPVTRYRPMASDPLSESPARGQPGCLVAPRRRRGVRLLFSLVAAEPRFARQRLVSARFGGQAADVPRLRRLAQLARQRCERSGRVADVALPAI